MALNNEHIRGADELVAMFNELKQYIDQDVPVVIGVEAVKHFKQNFQEEGFVDRGVTKWASRKTKRSGGTNGQKILSKSGELAESIDYSVSGRTTTISTDKPYAEIHNEGGEITVTAKMKSYFWAMHMQAKEAGDLEMADQYKGMALAKKIKMPERKFIGDSDALYEKIENKILRDLKRIAGS